MTRLRREAHARILGDGLCTRPVEVDCRMESACETCAYFATGPSSSRSSYASEITPRPDRAALFDDLLNLFETLLTAITHITAPALDLVPTPTPTPRSLTCARSKHRRCSGSGRRTSI